MATQSQQAVTVSTIIMTINAITPSIEPSDPQIILLLLLNFIGIVGSKSQQAVTVLTIITPSKEPNVDSQCKIMTDIILYIIW